MMAEVDVKNRRRSSAVPDGFRVAGTGGDPMRESTTSSHHSSSVINNPQTGVSTSAPGNSSGFSKSKPFVKGPLYVRYDERWILCQAEVTHTRLRISVHPEAQMEYSFRQVDDASSTDIQGGGHSMTRNPSTLAAAGGRNNNKGSSNSLKKYLLSPEQLQHIGSPINPNEPTKTGGDRRPTGFLTAGFLSPTMSPQQTNLSEQQQLELYGLGLESPPAQSTNKSLMTSSHPLNRSVDVTKICEVKLLNFLHYFDKFTFEVVCKRSSRVRSKLSHLSQPAHFGQSVNETVGECHGDRYEVLTFKAPNEKALFEWVDGIEDAVDPVEQLLKNVVQQMPESVTGDSPWRPELPVYGQVKACFGPSQAQHHLAPSFQFQVLSLADDDDNNASKDATQQQHPQKSSTSVSVSRRVSSRGVGPTT